MEHHTMTAEEARTFERVSLPNAAILMQAAKDHGCDCQPYQDWFTFNRWHAQGLVVRKGEHGIKLPVIIETTKEDKDTGEVKQLRRPWSTTVFCRHQVTEASHV